MSVSTILHPTSERRAALVRTIDGVDAPTAGTWHIATGQRVGLVARGLRTRARPGRVQCGTFVVTDDLLGSSLDFTVLVPDVGCSVGFAARVTRLLSVDSWQADGAVTTASGSRPVSLRLRDNGVFHQRGRQPCLWLTIHSTVDASGLGISVGSRPAGRLKIDAELNLHPRGVI